MKNLPPGHNSDFTNKAKILTSDDWNDLNNNLIEQSIGGVEATYDESGSHIPTDAVHTPFYGQIDNNFTDVVIGLDREEDYYPFIDSLSINVNKVSYTTTEAADGTKWLGNLDLSDTQNIFPFLTKDVVEDVPAATDIYAGMVVGYKFINTPTVTSHIVGIGYAITYVPNIGGGQDAFFTMENTSGNWEELLTQSVEPEFISYYDLLSGSEFNLNDYYKTKYFAQTSAYVPIGVAFHTAGGELDHWIQLPITQIGGGGQFTGTSSVSAEVSASVVYNPQGAIQFDNDKNIPGYREFYSTSGDIGDGHGQRGWYDLSAVVPVSASVQYSDYSSVENCAITFINDEGSPGTGKYYGTDPAGVRHWLDLQNAVSGLLSGVLSASVGTEGLTQTNDETVLASIDASTDNQITFGRVDHNWIFTDGLAQQHNFTAQTSENIDFGGIWISEKAASIFHDANIESEADPNHLDKIELDNSGASLVMKYDGAVVDDLILYRDRAAHIYRIDHDSVPTTATISGYYKYKNCDDSTDIIYRQTNAGDVIRVSDICYEFIDGPIGASEIDITAIDAVLSGCAECELALSGYLYKKCSDDTAAEILSTDEDDYLWMLVGGEYIKTYYSSMSSLAATDPCFVGDPTGTPTQCSDIVPDWFSNMDCAAGVLDPCYWEVLRDQTTETCITDGIEYVVDGGGTRYSDIRSRVPIDGNFTARIDYDITNFLANNSTNQTFAFIVKREDTDAEIGRVSIEKSGGDSTTEWLVLTWTPGGGVMVEVTNHDNDGYFTISRSGTTISWSYDGVGGSQTGTYAGDVYVMLRPWSNWGGFTIEATGFDIST